MRAINKGAVEANVIKGSLPNMKGLNAMGSVRTASLESMAVVGGGGGVSKGKLPTMKSLYGVSGGNLVNSSIQSSM